jgi:hypothetical protein
MRRIAPLLALLLVPSVARAADPPKSAREQAAARGLFYEARTLMQQNKFAEACPKLEESLRLDPGLGTQFNLADCNEHIGQITTAWAGFLDVAAHAKAAHQADREKVARKRAAALEPRLPKLVVEVTGAPQGLEVKRDGVVVGSAAWGTAIAVDPGTHKISASAPGKQTWETTVTSIEAKTARVTVPRELPPAPGAVPVAVVPAAPTVPPSASIATTTTTTAAADGRTGEESFPPPVVEHGGSTQRTVGWIVTGVGAVGLGLGAGFGLSSIGKRDESRQHCVGDSCDAVGVGLRDDAIRNGNIATIATIAGGAALAGGLILVFTAPKSTESRAGRLRAVPNVARLRAVPNVAVGGGGFMLEGKFQ